jgi:hypothetical protein
MDEKNDYEKALEHLSVYREMIRHENDLLDKRLGWLFTLQGFLFTSISFIWDKNDYAVLILCVVGILTCISIGYTLGRGANATFDLVTNANKYKKSFPDTYQFPPVIGAKRKAIEWLLPSRILPWIIGSSWLILFAIKLIEIA